MTFELAWKPRWAMTRLVNSCARSTFDISSAPLVIRPSPWVPAGVIDLAHAAPSAPPQLHAAYAAALDELPRYLPGTGYDYRGVPALRERLAERFTARGLPTTPDQILITSGALEMSNVDLAQEFTNLVIAERGFQANSRVITTSDELLQDLVNLKH